METIITIKNAFGVMAIIGVLLILRKVIRIISLPPIEEAIENAIYEAKEEAIKEAIENAINEEKEMTIETIDEKEIKTNVIMTYINYHNNMLLGLFLLTPITMYFVINYHNWLSWLAFFIVFLLFINSSLKIKKFVHL